MRIRDAICACLLLFCFAPAYPYKMVVLVLDISNSQLLFNKRVAEALAEAGHDVTLALISPQADRDSSDIKIASSVRVHTARIESNLSRKAIEDHQEEFVFKDLPFKKLMERFNVQLSMIVNTCRATINNKDFVGWLERERFDLAFGHMFDICSIGLIHNAKIPSWIWLNSGSVMDYVAYYIGAPLIPSYVPPMMMEAGGEMNFIQRTKSFIGHGLTQFFWKRLIADPETALFRELISSDFPDLLELAAKCPVVMANTNNLYEIPRPTLAKIVNIGGIGMESTNAKPLPENIADIVAKGKGTVLFSLGSVTAAHKMPYEWKMAFLEAFRQFPDYQFLVKYEKEDLDDKLPDNVHLFKWLPQSDILHHPKTKAFISHGGYNSVQEAILTGMPLIAVPLFGDQPKNARLAERHGFGVILHKKEISVDTISSAIREVTENPRYAEKATRMLRMIQHQPVDPTQQLVKWAEFAAEFQTLENLEPAGNRLNFIQYHSLDVIAFLGAILTLTILVIIVLLRTAFMFVRRLIFGARKQKTA